MTRTQLEKKMEDWIHQNLKFEKVKFRNLTNFVSRAASQKQPHPWIFSLSKRYKRFCNRPQNENWLLKKEVSGSRIRIPNLKINYFKHQIDGNSEFHRRVECAKTFVFDTLVTMVLVKVKSISIWWFMVCPARYAIWWICLWCETDTQDWILVFADVDFR